MYDIFQCECSRLEVGVGWVGLTCPTSGTAPCVDSDSWRPTGCIDKRCCSSSRWVGGRSSLPALYTPFCKRRSEKNAWKNQLNSSRKLLIAKGTRCDKLPAYIICGQLAPENRRVQNFKFQRNTRVSKYLY